MYIIYLYIYILLSSYLLEVSLRFILKPNKQSLTVTFPCLVMVVVQAIIILYLVRATV